MAAGGTVIAAIPPGMYMSTSASGDVSKLSSLSASATWLFSAANRALSVR